MKITRPYASDYKQQMLDLVNQITKLDMVVTTRLYVLNANHPKAPIRTIRNEGENVIITADSLIPATRGKSIIKDLPFDTRIEYIANIEKWITDSHPHKQTELEFSNNCNAEICNCDKRDMPVYEEEGMRWCPQCGLQVK